MNKYIGIFLLILFFSTNYLSAQNIQLDKMNLLLENTYDLDQNIRYRLDTIMKKKGVHSPEYSNCLKEMIKQDSINQHIVLSILDSLGWLGHDVVSQKASSAFFYIIQHANLDIQKHYSDSIKSAFTKGHISTQEFSTFTDRLNMRQGTFQTYGSQTGRDLMGNEYLFPVIDIENLDKRRISVNMKPILDELKQNTKLHLPPQIAEGDNKVVIIGHIMQIDSQQVGVPNVKMYINEECIGKSDSTGFIMTVINKRRDEDLSLYVENGENKIMYPIKGDNNFYDIYIDFE